MGDVIKAQFGGRSGGGKTDSMRPARERQPVRPIGVHCAALGITTGHFEERLLTDVWGDQWMPPSYIALEGRGMVLLNCADPFVGSVANDQE